MKDLPANSASRFQPIIPDVALCRQSSPPIVAWSVSLPPQTQVKRTICASLGPRATNRISLTAPCSGIARDHSGLSKGAHSPTSPQVSGHQSCFNEACTTDRERESADLGRESGGRKKKRAACLPDLALRDEVLQAGRKEEKGGEPVPAPRAEEEGERRKEEEGGEGGSKKEKETQKPTNPKTLRRSLHQKTAENKAAKQEGPAPRNTPSQCQTRKAEVRSPNGFLKATLRKSTDLTSREYFRNMPWSEKPEKKKKKTKKQKTLAKHH